MDGALGKLDRTDKVEFSDNNWVYCNHIKDVGRVSACSTITRRV